MSELQIMRCTACQTAHFPDRLRCPACGATSVERVPAGPGTLEEETTVRRPAPPAGEEVRLGSVRLDAGPLLVARLTSGTHARARVTIDRSAEGVLWARHDHAR